MRREPPPTSTPLMTRSNESEGMVRGAVVRRVRSAVGEGAVKGWWVDFSLGVVVVASVVLPGSGSTGVKSGKSVTQMKESFSGLERRSCWMAA